MEYTKIIETNLKITYTLDSNTAKVWSEEKSISNHDLDYIANYMQYELGINIVQIYEEYCSPSVISICKRHGRRNNITIEII